MSYFKEFIKRKKERQKIKIFSFFLVFILLFLLTLNLKFFLELKNLQETSSFLENKIRAEKEMVQELERQSKFIESDFFKEKILREKGFYKKPEEEVYTIIFPENVIEKIIENTSQ